MFGLYLTCLACFAITLHATQSLCPYSECCYFYLHFSNDAKIQSYSCISPFCMVLIKQTCPGKMQPLQLHGYRSRFARTPNGVRAQSKLAHLERGMRLNLLHESHAAFWRRVLLYLFQCLFWYPIETAPRKQVMVTKSRNCWIGKCSLTMAARGHQELASCQIRKIAGCTCAGNGRNVFPSTAC